ncbi:MAG TPA: hypothetical protein VI895_13910 [Bdellovibrionota bacterium]|nr:hypothetical protein [Bdellovibrionota bacterium]
MKNKRILFLNPAEDPALQRTVHRALAATGCNVFVASGGDDAQRYLAAGCDLVLLNYDEGGESVRALANQLLSRQDCPTVLLSQKKEKEHLIHLFSHDQLRNLIARNNEVSEAELMITTEKLLRQDIFGMEKYLTWGAHLEEEPVHDSLEKTDQVARVGRFVEQLKCDARFVKAAQVVADELLMNALYDAPIGADGKSLYAHKPRSERVTLSSKDQATLRYGSDGRYFAIACRDHFGSLRAQTVVQYLKKCFLHDENQVDTKAGGAGVGFYMVFQSLSQMIINIEPGKMTETIGLIDIRTSYRDTKMRTKSFNIFIR